MKLNKLAIRNAVEYHLRNNKVQGYQFQDPLDITSDPNTRLPKLPGQMEPWVVRETKVTKENGDIQTWLKNDNLANMRDALTDILFDIFADAEFPIVDVSTTPGKKNIVMTNTGSKTETIVDQIYTFGGGPRTADTGNVKIELDMGKTYTFKLGPLFLFELSEAHGLRYSQTGGLVWMTLGEHHHSYDNNGNPGNTGPVIPN